MYIYMTEISFTVTVTLSKHSLTNHWSRNGSSNYISRFVYFSEGILVHKASFGDKLPHPKEKSNQWTPTEDILFGTTMSLNALQSNVAKLGLNIGDPIENKGENVDQISVTKVMSENISAEEVHDDSMSERKLSENLPDVVQRVDSQRKVDDMSSSCDSPKLGRKDSSSSLRSVGSASLKSLESASIKSLESGSQKSLDSASVSHEGSPIHKVGAVSEDKSNKHLSLTDLQDPNTFTVGTNEGSKRKITKASFDNPQPTITENFGDPGDPLSSLDPLWSLKKWFWLLLS